MSADDNAPEQAREVEVVGMTHAVETVLLSHAVDDLVDVATLARAIAEATEMYRAAERQEAAREALLAAADDVAERIAGVVDPDSWRRDGFDEGWAHAGEKIDDLLRDRADGVTGRSGT